MLSHRPLHRCFLDAGSDRSTPWMPCPSDAENGPLYAWLAGREAGFLGVARGRTFAGLFISRRPLDREDEGRHGSGQPSFVQHRPIACGCSWLRSQCCILICGQSTVSFDCAREMIRRSFSSRVTYYQLVPLRRPWWPRHSGEQYPYGKATLQWHSGTAMGVSDASPDPLDRIINQVESSTTHSHSDWLP
jgi:hypothetical protein